MSRIERVLLFFVEISMEIGGMFEKLGGKEVGAVFSPESVSKEK